jgi:uncharacterized protein (TIGR02145 family)
MSKFRGSFIAGLARVAAVAAFSAFLWVGCGSKDDDDDSGGGGGDGGTPTYTSDTKSMGGKTWMVENLNIETANSWCYDEDPANCAIYGRLYTWNAAKMACPSPWRLPTREDWIALVAEVGGSLTVVGAGWYSSTGAEHLKSQSWDNGTNSTGFSALPGGARHPDGTFAVLGSISRWWAKEEVNASSAHGWGMDIGKTDVNEYGFDKSVGFSVRCVQD